MRVELYNRIQGVVTKGLHMTPMTYFNIFTGVMILANAVVMGVEIDIDLGRLGFVLNHVFTATWTVEVVIRNINLTPSIYFADAWNWMDFSLACLSVIDAWVLPATSDGGGNHSLKMLSILRIFRMLRLLRLVKFLKMFRELWLLVNGLITALGVLSWVVFLLCIVLYVAALFMTNFVGKECERSYPSFDNCDEMFSTIPLTMYSLFQVITLESWSMEVSRPVLRESPGLVVFYLCFLYLTTFGFVNIVTGVIVEQTLQASQKEEDLCTQMKDARAKQLPMLKNFFREADADGSGFITLDEFLGTLSRTAHIREFENFNLNAYSKRTAVQLFEVLDRDHKGEIPVDDLINRIQDLLEDGGLSSFAGLNLLIECRHLAFRLGTIASNGGLEEAGLNAQRDAILKAIANMENRINERVATLDGKYQEKLQFLEDHASQLEGSGDAPHENSEETTPIWFDLNQ